MAAAAHVHNDRVRAIWHGLRDDLVIASIKVNRGVIEACLDRRRQPSIESQETRHPG
jgi:hypothetical protein